jgi:hypothetical protein
MATTMPINAMSGPIIPHSPANRVEMMNSNIGCKFFCSSFSVKEMYPLNVNYTGLALRIEIRLVPQLRFE